MKIIPFHLRICKKKIHSTDNYENVNKINANNNQIIEIRKNY